MNPPMLVEEITEVIQDAMTFDFRGVPIIAEVSEPGVTWADCYGGK